MPLCYMRDFKKNLPRKARKIVFSKCSFLGISSEILSVCRNGRCRKTRIMQECNLSHVQLQAYLESLTELQLLTVIGSESMSYQTTEKGQEFLEKFQDLEDSLGIYL